MSLEQMQRLKVRLFAVFMVVVVCYLVFAQFTFNTNYDEMIEGERMSSEPIAPPSPALQEIDKIAYQDPAKAVELARKLLSSGTEAEKNGAKERLKRALLQQFEQASKSRDLEKAAKLHAELTTLPLSDYEKRDADARLENLRAQVLMDAI